MRNTNNIAKTFSVAVFGDATIADNWNRERIEISGDNINISGAGAAMFVHLGLAGTAYARVDTAYLGKTSSAGQTHKWGNDRTTKAPPTSDVSFAVSWTNRVVPAGGEFQLLLCGGDPNDWAVPPTNVDSMSITNATTTQMDITATIHESGTIDPTTWSDTLAFEFAGGVELEGPPNVTQLTGKNFLVTVTVKNPTTSHIANGGFAIFGDVNVVDGTANFAENYGASQGFLFKFNSEVFWRFIVRWTSGLGSDATGWWFGPRADLNANIWNADSAFPTSVGDYAMATSWQGIDLAPGEVKTIRFMIGTGFLGFDQPLPSPTPKPTPTPVATPTSSDVFHESNNATVTMPVNATETVRLTDFVLRGSAAPDFDESDEPAASALNATSIRAVTARLGASVTGSPTASSNPLAGNWTLKGWRIWAVLVPIIVLAIAASVVWAIMRRRNPSSLPAGGDTAETAFPTVDPSLPKLDQPLVSCVAMTQENPLFNTLADDGDVASMFQSDGPEEPTARDEDIIF